jgi:hypothetical protein
MQELTQIRDHLHNQLDWHGARLNFLSMFLVALFRVRTVNLSELALAFPSSAHSDSSYKRLQRFLRDFEFSYGDWAQAMLRLVGVPEPWTLTLDRTNWRFGGSDHNILMLGVCYEGVSIPLLWWMLDKRGNSNTTERILLLEEFREVFPTVKVAAITADREFVGQDWFAYLLTHSQGLLRIRVRQSELLFDGKQSVSGQRVFAALKVGERCILRHRRRLWGHWVKLMAVRLPDNELLIIATQDSVRQALADYAKRWSIETLFGILKSRGFNLEDTHLQQMERLSKLVALLTLAMIWAIRTGEYLAQQTPITIKKHGRPTKSLFRYGCDFIRQALLNPQTASHKLSQAINFLSCT